jgi:hypothetical protein
VFLFEVKKGRKIVLRNGGFVISAATDQFGVAVTLAALKRQLAVFLNIGLDTGYPDSGISLLSSVCPGNFRVFISIIPRAPAFKSFLVHHSPMRTFDVL